MLSINNQPIRLEAPAIDNVISLIVRGKLSLADGKKLLAERNATAHGIDVVAKNEAKHLERAPRRLRPQ